MAEGIDIGFSLKYLDGPGINVAGLRLAADPGKVAVLFGPSGSGKTTVLRVLAGLTRPDTGRVVFRGQVWFDTRQPLCLPPQQRNIGFVQQDYGLFPHLTVAQNVAYGLRALPAAERDARVHETLDWLDISDLSRRRPSEISGGQQQRVALARAVARRPQLLLLDEPLAALDAPTRRHLRGELHALLVRTGIPSIVVTHDPSEALALADEIVLLNGGRVIQTGTPENVFNHPASIEAAEILGVDTMLDGIVSSQDAALVQILAHGVRLTAVSREPLPAGTRAAICIRAEDVMLARPKADSGSARNRLPGTVLHTSDEAGLVRIQLDCGFLLRASLTRQSCQDLDIRPGSPIDAIIKAPNVHLIPRVSNP